MHVIDHQPPRASRRSRYAAFALVAAIHLLLLALLALQRAGVFPPVLPPIEVLLVPGGGGDGRPSSNAADAAAARQAAPSSLHVPPTPQPYPDTLVAPPQAAPQELAPVLTPGTPDAPAGPAGAAPVLAGTGASQGGGSGAGSGAGTGDGAGGGVGDGVGSDVVLIRGPAGATITRNVSPGAMEALPGPWVVMRCRVTDRLEDCRILRQHPGGAEVRLAALARAAEFRFRPARAGRTVRGQAPRIYKTFGIGLPPETGAPSAPR